MSYDPEWLVRGIDGGYKYIVVVCDTFSYEDYPIFCHTEEERDKAKKDHNGINMQRIMEVITL